MARKPAQSGPIPVDAIVHKNSSRTNIPTVDGAERWADPASLQREPLEYQRYAGFAAERASRNESLDPQLVWRGKDLQDDGDLIVEAPPLYIQEKIDPRVLVDNLRRSAAERTQPNETPEPEMLDIFGDFDGELDELQQIEYYQHEAKWSNRMILGDSLQAMGSLAEREGLRGKVQMVYLDPPYGIKFNSNWQVSARKRDVKDGKDTAREVEQIKAFRDTWKDGIHTYLAYLRDRLVAARELLTESGSVFVQIGDENVHRVRALMDEVFGAENFIAQIYFVTTSGRQDSHLDSTGNYLLWYANDETRVKSRPLRTVKADPGTGFDTGDLQSQGVRSTGSYPVEIAGRVFRPASGNHWKVREEGMRNLILADRVHVARTVIRFKRYDTDLPSQRLTDVWTDTGGGAGNDKVYVVQTASKLVQRCMLMTTDPGDLVLDPTCGSGTTAYLAEQWGRRWITMDTSRVALALARQRLMGGRFPYYYLADTPEGRTKEAQASGKSMPTAETRGDIRQGFVYERVQHITLKSIANNPDIHEGMTREQIDAAIKKHADFELLYDKPYEDKKRVRVTGPFTVESLSPYRSVDQRDDNASRSEKAGEADAMGADYTQTILENLRSAGIQNGRKAERIEFAALTEHAGTHVQAIGERQSDEGLIEVPSSQVAIAIGPEYGTVSAAFVRNAAREALENGDVDMLCVFGFSFDPNVSSVSHVDDIELDASDEGFASVEGERKLGKLKVLIVRMNAELLMGDALKKTGAGNLFTVFGEPDVEIRAAKGADAERIEVELHGVDVYDAVKGEVRPSDTSQVALWMIDTDYDEESFFVRHCYFTGGNDPMKKLKVALKADIDAEAWEHLYRTVSIPFEYPSTGKIAIKVINDYGDEVMKVYEVN